MSRTAIVVLLAASVKAFAQGTFVDLNFETPILPLVPDPLTGRVPITNALPGWSGYIAGTSTNGGVAVSGVFYNAISLGSAVVALFGPGYFPSEILQGNYTASLQPATVGTFAAAIGQTGQIPQNAASLVFLAAQNPANVQVSFASQLVPVFQIGSAANYVTLAGDISAFAGQTGELRFTMLAGGGFLRLDDIQFSSQPIPEPGVAGLCAFGSGLLGWLWRKRTRT